MIWFFLFGCSSSQEDSALECDSESTPIYSDWVEGFLSSKCQSCHASTSANRYGAPEDIYFDTEEAALYWLEDIERTVIQTPSMPPSAGVRDEELLLLQQWIDCHKGLK